MADLIVVDTNVLVAALRSASGRNRDVIRCCLEGRRIPLIGTSLFLEYADVMSRETMFENCPVGASDRITLFKAFLSVCRWTQVYYLWRPNLPDEGDNHIMELALAGGASVLVTNNIGDFLSGELRFPEIKVMRPSEFMKGLT